MERKVKLLQGVVTYSDQDTLVLEVDVGDAELVGERHVRWKSNYRVREKL